MRVAPRYRLAGDIYAIRGERTYCENGHYLGHFTKCVMVGAFAEPSDFHLIAPMQLGVSECPHCGGLPCADVGIYYFARRGEDPGGTFVS